METSLAETRKAQKEEGAKADLVQIAPGIFVDPKRVTLDQERHFLLLDADGYKALGLRKGNGKSLLRLFECGKIKLHRITPRLSLLDLDSWREHMQQVGEDPWYWENTKNLSAYRGTYE